MNYSEDVLLGTANFNVISPINFLKENHSHFVNIGGSEGYTGAETSGGGADPNAIPATQEAQAQRKQRENKNQERQENEPSDNEREKEEE